MLPTYKSQAKSWSMRQKNQRHSGILQELLQAAAVLTEVEAATAVAVAAGDASADGDISDTGGGGGE